MNFFRNFPTTRLRRPRQADFSRRLVRENHLSCNDLLAPLFVIEGQGQREEIQSMAGTFRYSMDLILEEVSALQALKVPAVLLFPKMPESVKDKQGSYAGREDGLIPQTVRLIKQHFPEMGVMADVALDPYTDHGQDGVIDANGNILNEETNTLLAQQALTLARAGIDVVAPSDMMDGRVGVIRKHLDNAGFSQTQILSYAAKYASCFYGPFRDAVGSAKFLGKSNKLTYQMDPANSDEALHEAALDLQEGADMLMVKPGLPYLDIVYRIKETFQVPTFVYQVSGEYTMLNNAMRDGFLRSPDALHESLMAFKRAGADAIATYFAKRAAEEIQKGNFSL